MSDLPPLSGREQIELCVLLLRMDAIEEEERKILRYPVRGKSYKVAGSQ